MKGMAGKNDVSGLYPTGGIGSYDGNDLDQPPMFGVDGQE
jgi:hypothetical protein